MWNNKYLLYVSALCLVHQVSACTNAVAIGVGACRTSDDGFAAYGNEKVANLKDCSNKCRDGLECQAFAFRLSDGDCYLYKDGAYTKVVIYGSNAAYNCYSYNQTRHSDKCPPSCTNTDGTLLNSAECGCGSIGKCGCSHGTTTVSMNLDTIKLVNRGSTPSYPLTKCQGDCDSDSHCADGLKCFQRSNGEAIPGCHGTSSDMPSTYDVCTEFISDTTYNRYSPWEPLLQTVLTSDVSVLSTTINWTDQGSGYQRGYL